MLTLRGGTGYRIHTSIWWKSTHWISALLFPQGISCILLLPLQQSLLSVVFQKGKYVNPPNFHMLIKHLFRYIYVYIDLYTDEQRSLSGFMISLTESNVLLRKEGISLLQYDKALYETFLCIYPCILVRWTAFFQLPSCEGSFSFI